MKEIAKNLEKALMDFLQADLLTKNWNYKAGPNKWSKKEIIGHLIDSAQINLQRFVDQHTLKIFHLPMIRWNGWMRNIIFLPI